MRLARTAQTIMKMIAAQEETREQMVDSLKWYVADLRKLASSTDYDEKSFILSRVGDYGLEVLPRMPKAPSAKAKAETIIKFCDQVTSLIDKI